MYGGASGVSGVSGSVTEGGVVKILACMHACMQFDNSIKLVDAGASIGRWA